MGLESEIVIIYVNKHKMMMIEAGDGDGQSLLNHFKVKASEDPIFFTQFKVIKKIE